MSRGEMPPLVGKTSEIVDSMPETGDLPISGRVLDASGGEIVGALVQARGSEGQTLGTALSTSDGRFNLSVATSTVELSTSAEGYSSDVHRIDAPYGSLILSLTPAASIEGRIVVAGTDIGVAGVRVIATNLDDVNASARVGQSDESGAFTFAKLAAAATSSWVSHPSGAARRSLSVWLPVMR